jgi:aldehyde dehydrogenase (NAD+)
VDEDANIDLTAKRIAWGKFFNAGQTCITADYILAHKNIRDKLVESLRKYLTQFYGDEPKNSKSFARVISKDHTKRLANLFNMGRVVIGGKSDVEVRLALKGTLALVYYLKLILPNLDKLYRSYRDRGSGSQLRIDDG